MAICDSEREYLRRILDYAGKHSQYPIAIQIFTDTEELVTFLEKTPVSILLIAPEKMPENMEHFDVECCLLLWDGETLQTRKPYPYIGKFQSCDLLLSQVMKCYADQNHSSLIFQSQERPFSVRGFYSPIPGTEKTAFAMKLGQELARTKKVLYLNLEGYTGFEDLLSMSAEEDLSDLLYYLRKDENGFICRLNGMLQSFWGMDYVRPARSPSDVREASREDISLLLKRIVQGSLYEEILLDLSDLADGLFPILRSCKVVYTPVQEDEVSNARRLQYENDLIRQGYRDVLEKTKYLKLPSRNENGILFRQAQWDDMTFFVRRLLKEES